MKKSFVFLWALFMFFSVGGGTASAHPHAFVEAYVSFVFDEQGLAGVKERWVLDPMVSIQVLELVGSNFDETLDANEQRKIKDMAFINLKEYGYFTDIRIDGKRFRPEWAADFSCALEKGQLIYMFTIPCHVTASEHEKTVKAAVYDETFYTFVAYGVEGADSIDPTQDPKFGDQSQPARPDDFARFSEAVGLGEYQGGVRMEGDLAPFVISGRVEKASDMAYFHDQITPEALVVRFRRK